MKVLLPRGAALDLLAELLPDRKLGAQVLDYWLKKRNQEGGPLLARLWFEQPWKVRQPALEGAVSASELAGARAITLNTELGMLTESPPQQHCWAQLVPTSSA